MGSPLFLGGDVCPLALPCPAAVTSALRRADEQQQTAFALRARPQNKCPSSQGEQSPLLMLTEKLALTLEYMRTHKHETYVE